MTLQKNVLSIVIPALNEEESIESIIRRTLQAKQFICAHADVSDIEIIVVSDGSTDRTVERAQQFSSDIRLIIFEKNRGYGAAIKKGWEEATGNLLGFLDADGTCDPNFFAELCNLVTRQGADVALGSRLNKNSKMPPVRRVGNLLFSFLLSYLSESKVNDTASGMRVVKKDSLPFIMPLPDGLHFTPAMSARAILSDDLTILEKDMNYHEREGESKLHVWKDGVRFLNVILKATVLYKPNRLLNLAAAVSLLAALAVIAEPAFYYLRNRSLLDWMIYRFIVSNILGVLSLLFFSASYLSEKMVKITLSKDINMINENKSLVAKVYNSKLIWVIATVFFITGVGMVIQSVIERINTGHTNEHWSRYIALSFFLVSAFVLVVTKVIDFVLQLITERVLYLQSTTVTKPK